MTDKSTYSNARVLTVVAVSVAAAGLAAITLCAPRIADDWFYSLAGGHDYTEFFSCGGEPVTGLSDALAAIGRHYMLINGRLADKLLILTTLIPVFIARLGIALLWGVGLWKLAHMCGGREMPGAPLFVSMLVCCTWWMLPWEDCVVSLACEFNYVLPAALCLIVSERVIADKRSGVWCCLLALIAGAMHESSSAGVCAGMLALCLMKRGRLSRSQWAMCLSFGAGTLILLAMPGTWQRAGFAKPNELTLLWIVKTMLLLPAVWLLIAALVAAAIRRRRPAAVDRPALVYMLASTAAAMLPGILAMVRGRCYWWGAVSALACAFILLRSVWPGIMRGHARWSCGVTLLLGVWLASVAREQYCFGKAQARLEQVIAAHPGIGVVWADVPSYTDASPLHLGTAQPPVGDYFLNVRAMGLYYNRGNTEDETVVFPTRLRWKHFTKWPSVEGNIGGAYGAFPIYYAPGMGPEAARGFTRVRYTFDVRRAPLTPANLPLKALGRTHGELDTEAQVLAIPKRRIAPADLPTFTDPATGEVPDTLCFIYVELLPHRYLLAPLTGISRP